MAVYGYSEERIESIIRARQQWRLRYCTVAVAILAAACVVALTRPEWIFGPHQQARGWVLLALLIFVAGPLVDSLWRWNKRPDKIRESLRNTHILLKENAVEVADSNSANRFERSEILAGEEVEWGIYLRTRQRHHWILVSSQIDQFEEFKGELQGLRIPITPARIPPNWEELAGAVVFIAVMLCAVFARSAAVLTADLVISVIVAVIGFAVVSANPENRKKMQWARFGIFLPVAMTASMLGTALQ